MYSVDILQVFKRQAKKLLSPEQYRRLGTLYDRLSENPFLGDPLGPEWFREVRMGGKRLYFLVGKKKVLLVGVSGKKDQQGTIDTIRENLSEYQQHLHD